MIYCAHILVLEIKIHNSNSENSNQSTIDSSLNQTFSSTQGFDSDNKVVTIKILTPILQDESSIIIVSLSLYFF